MGEYYGVVSSSDFFAHYGVKGMKWGVRKALESPKRDAKLARQYNKALRKAKRLNTNANVKRSQQEFKQRMADGATELATGGFAAGASLVARALSRKWGMRGVSVGHVGFLPMVYDTETAPKVLVPAGAALGAAGVYNLAKGVAAKRRTTVKGHAKAVAKAKNWQSEMKKAFKGTKYAGLPGVRAMKEQQAYESVSTQLKNAGKAAALGGAVMGPGAAMYVNARKVASEDNRYKSKKKRR